ncbi:MAG: ATP-binding protein [Bacteroidales bacterium]|nr:ATP-binding protein [Candidatus Colicola equi]
MIQRQLLQRLSQTVQNSKVTLLVGARQVGKTTLLKEMISQSAINDVLWLNGDLPQVRATLESNNLQEISLLIHNVKVVIIDEAQRINAIGLTLKIIVDTMPDVKLFVTGSSAFELRNQLDEPLTGRKTTYYLYPISTQELFETEGLIAVKERLESRLIYGSYPEVITSNTPKDVLMELAGSYLFKDVLQVDGLRRANVLEKLLTALALQVGSEVNYNELSKTIGIDRKTVEKYIDILEKCYIIFHLNSFSRNIRTELTKGKKIYFYDTGIRNAILKQFAPLELRQDIGALWENFFIAERMKYNHYRGQYVNTYFWRTTDKQEIDYIEEQDGELKLFELKWNPKKQNSRIPNVFFNTYHPNQTAIITRENYITYLI